MEEVVVLEWTFSPADFFEEPIEISSGGVRMTIVDGKVEARIPADTYDGEPNMRDRLHELLNLRFLGVQLLSHRPYQLPKGQMQRQYPDGHRGFFMEVADTITLRDSIDMVVRDKNGNVKMDSRRERIERKREMADLAALSGCKNPIVGLLLRACRQAVNDPDNELVHLFEIRDALEKKLGGPKEKRKTKAEVACDKLGFSLRRWRRLGHLASNLPLRQGRHRGKFMGSLRDATREELNEARRIASDLVESYMKRV